MGKKTLKKIHEPVRCIRNGVGRRSDARRAEVIGFEGGIGERISSLRGFRHKSKKNQERKIGRTCFA